MQQPNSSGSQHDYSESALLDPDSELQIHAQTPSMQHDVDEQSESTTSIIASIIATQRDQRATLTSSSAQLLQTGCPDEYSIGIDPTPLCRIPKQRFQRPPQLDGPRDYRPHTIPAAVRLHPAAGQARNSTTETSGEPQNHVPKNAIRDLLPFCTAEAPLTEEQVIALSDMAGSLKEVMLLALQAQRNGRVATDLKRAVGEDAAGGIVEFFTDEFEM